MILYPAIDLRGGRVVRLTEGRFDQEKSYSDDPLAVARGFAAEGAQWLHVVDLDGAFAGVPRRLVAVGGARVGARSMLATAPFPFLKVMARRSPWTGETSRDWKVWMTICLRPRS